MTVQNLNKILDRYESQLGIANSANKHFEILKGLPFYIWSPIRYSETDTSDMMSDYEDPVTCMAFNHAVGLPQKNGRSMPLFDYERLLFDTLQNHKHIWTKKATGLDVTEFVLRYMARLCLRNHDLYENAITKIQCIVKKS